MSIAIDAPVDRVWAIVSDPTRTPEWSPVCYRCEWIEEGKRFRGFNRLNGARWSRECVVTAWEPPHVFGFSTLFKDRESTRWRYTVEDGRLTEAYQVVLVPRWVRALRRLPGAMAKTERDMRRNIDASLGRIKALAEAG